MITTEAEAEAGDVTFLKQSCSIVKRERKGSLLCCDSEIPAQLSLCNRHFRHFPDPQFSIAGVLGPS